MNISIYGPQVSQTEAAQWLQNNPEKSTDATLLKVADYNRSQDVDAVELSTAANNGVLVLDSVTSFKLMGDEPETTQTASKPAVLQPSAQAATVGQSHSNAAIGAVGALASVFGGLTIATKNPVAGIGVMVGGLMLSAVIGSSKH